MPLQSGKHYVFINRAGGTALDLDVNSKQVQGWSRHGGPNQQWIVNMQFGSVWVIENVQLAQNFLAVKGPSQDGQGIVCEPGLEAPGSERRDIWRIQEFDGAYVITPPGTQYCLDLADHGNSDDGTPVQLWTSSGGDNQRWEAQEV